MEWGVVPTSQARKGRKDTMTEKEKYQKIAVAYNAIETVREDTDDELWARKWLEEALVALDMWYEETDI